MKAVTPLAVALLPQSILHANWYAVLATFVAFNAILYASLSIIKIMPKPYVDDVFPRHGRRNRTRSIYPDGQNAPMDYQPSPGTLAARHDDLSGRINLRGTSFRPDELHRSRPSPAATKLAALLDVERSPIAG